MGGAVLGLAAASSRSRLVVRNLAKEWRALDRKELYRSIHRLYESKLVRYIEEKDGSINIVLNKAGKHLALRYRLEEMTIMRPKFWDSGWRIILFDIPETKKPLRDTLRNQLRQLGLVKLQKSVFVHPFECQNEIDFLIELYDARRYVRFIRATHIDNELHLKKKFNLLK